MSVITLSDIRNCFCISVQSCAARSIERIMQKQSINDPTVSDLQFVIEVVHKNFALQKAPVVVT